MPSPGTQAVGREEPSSPEKPRWARSIPAPSASWGANDLSMSHGVKIKTAYFTRYRKTTLQFLEQVGIAPVSEGLANPAVLEQGAWPHG